MLQGIVPDNVLWKVAEDWMWETPLCAAEEALIQKAVDKRKREFRAGRHCAHALLSEAGVQCAALLKGRQREPAWPEGWVGSISHSNGLCVVAIAPDTVYSSIGLDVEQASPLGEDILDLICSAAEQDQMTRLAYTTGRDLASFPLSKVIFSAKESIHKVYFPLNYHTLDFLDARVELNAGNGSFIAQILNPEPEPVVPINRLMGRFTIGNDFVATFIALEAVNSSIAS
ncbi:MAG: 4'-phosphopantetheinyl transferase family protein [Ketobacter sp.]